MWFRNDLRIDDNPALTEACKRSDRGVIAAFVYTPDQWRLHDWAPIKVDFIRQTLMELSDALARKNISLRLLTTPDFRGVPRALVELARECDCNAIYFNEEYEINEKRRDERVSHLFKGERGEICSFTDQCVFKPGSIRTGEGRFYTVYTPFKRAWYRAYESSYDDVSPVSKPRKLPEMIGKPDKIPYSFDGYKEIPSHAEHWTPGEKAASRRLSSFLETRVESYKDNRDIPSIDATSMLSPYLACGSISIRRCVYEAIQCSGGQINKGSPGAVHWISELIWREFYKHILVGFPRVSMHRAFNLSTERIKWIKNDEHLNAWQRGRTGVPIVDAAMRQLVQTGWMHNRLRMVTAMYLTKNLFIDWRAGERFFMQHLIDGDLAANNGGWQWSASTGTDAAPYFRIMNPHSQSKRFDPQGDFIRAYLPELNDLSAADIHDPSQLPSLVKSNLDYPEPIVDLSKSRRRAIETFQSLK